MSRVGIITIYSDPTQLFRSPIVICKWPMICNLPNAMHIMKCKYYRTPNWDKKTATLHTLFSGHFEGIKAPFDDLDLTALGRSKVDHRSHGSNAVNCKRSSDKNCVIDHAWCLIGADKISRSLPLVRGSSASCPTSSKRSPS